MFSRTPPLIDADGHDRRLARQVELPADDRLQAEDDLRRGDDRVDAAPGHGAVRLPAVHGDLHAVGSWPSPARAGSRSCPTVWREVTCRPKIACGTGFSSAPSLDHHLRAAFLALGRHLLGRLEDELDRAAQLRAQARPAPRPRPSGSRCGCRGRRHASRRPPRRSTACAPSRRKARRLLRPPATRPCRRAAPPPGRASAPFSRPTTPVWATPVRTSSRPSFCRCAATMADGAELAIAELGVGVEVAPPGDDAGLDRPRGFVDERGE